MSSLIDLLAAVGILSVLGGAVYLLRKRVLGQSDELRERLNSHDFVVIEADEVDFAALNDDWAREQWSYHSASRSDDGRTLYRFERSMPGATLLGDVLLDPSRKIAAADSYRGGPLKIKATGLRSAHAQKN